MKYLFSSLVAVLGCIQLGFGQQLRFQKYSVSNGLPQAQVHDIAQTPDGYIWMTTYGGGLVKFDGQRFIVYTTEDGLKDNAVEDLILDSNNDIWVTTSKGGAATFRGDSLVYPLKGDSINTKDFTQIEELSKNEMWIGVHKDGMYITRDDSVIKHLTTDDGLISNTIWNFLSTPDGAVWISTSAGISIYDNHSFTNYSVQDGLSGKKVYETITTENGNKWLATSRGITIWDGSEFKPIRTINGQTVGKVYDIMQASDGTIWMATKANGVYTFQDGVFRNITKKQGLSSDQTYVLFEDNHDNIWIGTDENGVSIYKDKGFQFYRKSVGLEDKGLLSIYKDKKGTFWYGTTNGVVAYDGQSYKELDLPKSYNEVYIWNITGLPNGHIVINSPGKPILEFDGKGFTNFSKKYDLGNMFVYYFYVDADNHIWIGSETGLYDINLKSGQVNHYTEKDGLAGNRVGYIYEAGDGKKWIGTDYGLSIFDGKNFKNIRVEDGLGHNKVIYITQDSLGHFWLGLGGGVSEYIPAKNGDPAQIHNFGKKDGMRLMYSHFLWFDKEGYLWQGTNAGLQMLDVPSYRKNGNMQITHYPLSSDDMGLEFNYHALWHDNGGDDAWMGSMNEAVHLNTDKLNRKIDLLPLHITDIRMNALPVNWSSYTNILSYNNGTLNFPSVSFPSGKNSYGFSFAALSYINPENVRYRYKLAGFEDHWRPVTKNMSATYTNLSPGDYTFIVEAKKGRGSFSASRASYHFSVAFPFWSSYWFYTLVLISLMGLVFGYIRFRINKLEKERLQELVDKQTEHLTKALEEKEVLIKEIHHRVKNNLAVISGLLELQMGHADDDFVNRVLSESQRRVQSISMIHEKLYQNKHLAEINFEKYAHELVDIIAYSFSNAEKDISVNIDIDDFKLGVDQGIPCGLILNELISNAYEHAFKDRQKGTIKVKISEDDSGKLTLIVSDNGFGMPENFNINESESLGLTLIATLCKQIEGAYHFEDADPGTRFVLQFQKEEALPQVPT